jgi:ketosteroid isomerase-like protein
MSQETIEAVRGVRIPLAGVETRPHRSLDERILVRFPALARRLGAAWSRLPQHSRLRRVMLVRFLRQGNAAANRRDFDVALRTFDPGIEWSPAQIFPDPDPTYYGHDGYREVWRLLLDAFEDLRLDPKEVLDLGDHLLITTEISGHGTGSGVSIRQRMFLLYTLRQGLVVREDDFLDRSEALEAAGLSE